MGKDYFPSSSSGSDVGRIITNLCLDYKMGTNWWDNKGNKSWQYHGTMMVRGIGEVNGLMNRGFSGVYWDNKGKKLWEYNGNIMGIESLCRCKTKKGHSKTWFSGILMGIERNIEHIYIYYVYYIYMYNPIEIKIWTINPIGYINGIWPSDRMRMRTSRISFIAKGIFHGDSLG